MWLILPNSVRLIYWHWWNHMVIIPPLAKWARRSNISNLHLKASVVLEVPSRGLKTTPFSRFANSRLPSKRYPFLRKWVQAWMWSSSGRRGCIREPCFMSYSHCYVTRVIASQFPLSRDALPVACYLTPWMVRWFTIIENIHNISVNFNESYGVTFDISIGRISHKRYEIGKF